MAADGQDCVFPSDQAVLASGRLTRTFQISRAPSFADWHAMGSKAGGMREWKKEGERGRGGRYLPYIVEDVGRVCGCGEGMPPGLADGF